MTLTDVLLAAVGLVAVAGGVAVVSTKQLVRAGLWLVVALGAVAVEFLLLGAEFAAWVQVLIYVGAVVVLLLFAVMLTRAPIGRSADLDRPALPAVLVGAAAGLGLAALFVGVFGQFQVPAPEVGTAERIGDSVFGDWVLPFEVLSILLLAALVGAIVLSRPAAPAPQPDAVAQGSDR
ncbi:NADH-quinone oxidoreductase subunit J family protein [Catellatospora citrea]|uniref:NADH-quinone oxidoreductase subunit J n=1 Tax=Catellatospora citrea TaxID=53366 RepID=A0A8J3KS89_9ACTN|nr:NADH-quinone oxidoreductase subunit J [Catellatospora citrea]RKE08387.1 NADH dehydrogenase subunit J [Catellatospora citrea]GIG02514.1 NADH dehydrogenase [Catellatospora citrea]